MYKPRQSKPLGWLLIVATGIFMIVTAAILYFFLPFRGALAGAIQGGGTFIFLSIGIFLIIFGRKKKASLADEILAKDTRPPIIYFRPFSTDGRAGFPTLMPTYEEKLSKALSTLGPFVAIGKPKERVPELGAAKMYFDDDVWKDKVREFAKNASLIVLFLGVSEGILWEIKAIKNLVSPQQVIIGLPMVKRGTSLDVKTYNEVSESISKILSLPPHNTIKGARFIFFDNSWNPILLKPDKNLNVQDFIASLKTEVTEMQISAFKRINDAFK